MEVKLDKYCDWQPQPDKNLAKLRFIVTTFSCTKTKNPRPKWLRVD